MMNPIRLAYIGCGFVAQKIHIPNFCAIPGCEVIAIAEMRQDLGKAVADRYRIPKVYQSHHEVARDPDIDGVGVSAPFEIQGRVAQDLLAAGKHVFMEKPMAVSVVRAREIVQTATNSGGRLMVGYMKRYDSGNLLLKQHLNKWRSSGEVGELIFARNHGFCGNWLFAQDSNVPLSVSEIEPPMSQSECPEWIPDRHRGSYIGYLQQWTHNINLLRYLLGDSEGRTKVISVDLDADGMTGIVVLRINGVRAVIESGLSRFHGWEEHTQVYFRDGWLKTEAAPLLQKEQPTTVELYRAGSDSDPPRKTTEYAEPSWAYREEAIHFVECLRTGEPFRSSGEDTLTDVRVFEEIYRAYLNL